MTRKENKMPSRPWSRTFVLLLGVAIAVPSLAWALEPLAVYENWQEADRLIRSDRWRGDEDSGGTEVARGIAGSGKLAHLAMRYRTEGFIVASPPTGQVVARNYMRFAQPTTITAIAARSIIHSLTLTPCPDNNSGGITSAQPLTLALARFNDGTSTGPADRTGDVEGVISAGRLGSSTDPTGVLQVTGSVIRSTGASGNFTSTLGSVTLGTVSVGHAFSLQVQWDQPNKQFLFSLNNEAPMAVVYMQSDTAEAVGPFAQIFQRHGFANCDDAPTVIDETLMLHQVETNASAVIP